MPNNTFQARSNRRTFVDDALEADDGEQSAGNGGGGNGAQDDQAQQATGVAARLSFEEEVGTARRGDVGGHVGDGGGLRVLAEGWSWHWTAVRVQRVLDGEV